MPASDELLPLLEAGREGDDVALAELIRRTQPVVWHLCSVLGSQGEEEDLVQETYLRAFRSLDRFRGDAPVRAWLLAIARHVCADHVRRRERQRRLLGRLRSTTTEDTTPAASSIDDILDTLDSDRREAFVLTQVVGLTYLEAAEVLGCPIGTVRSRVARARSQLHDIVIASEAR